MSKRLSDTQLVILSAACQRDGARVLPIAASLKGGAVNMVLRKCRNVAMRRRVAARRPKMRGRQQF
jgi:hypothetical protein